MLEASLSAGARIIGSGLAFPEGPIAMSDGGVVVVEMRSGRLTRLTPDGRLSWSVELGGGPNGAAIGPDGNYYICNNGGFGWPTIGNIQVPSGPSETYAGGSIQRVNPRTGLVDLLYTHCGSRRLLAPNDMVFDQHGGFWFTDFGRKFGGTYHYGGVFYAAADGSEIRCAVEQCLTPNGIGLSPDGRTLYVAETDTARLWSYPVRKPGELALAPWPSPNGGILVHGLPGYQRFDSMAVEANGNICVGTVVDGGICVFSPTGSLLERYAAPDRFCTNICFGGPDLQTAFVTLSGSGTVLALDWPRPGLRLAS